MIILKILYRLTLYINLRAHGVTHGENLRGNRVVLKNMGKIKIGNKVSLNSFPEGELFRTALHTHCKDATISIGNECNLNGTMIHCRTSVTIGDYCMFGPGSKIIDNDSHRISIDIDERRKPPNSAPIIIEDNVWVGSNSLILKGVTIGRNTIVAAHSVVTKNISANTLVAGNPAKTVKKLTK